MPRQEQLLKLQSYMKEVDRDITMILQNLQWDRSLLQKQECLLSTCQYDQNHKMPSNKLKEHEELCYLKHNGYSLEDTLLPEILDINVNTVTKFSTATINDILNNAAMKDPLFKRGHNSEEIEPLSADRLRAAYTQDERRALHDAVVSSVQATKDAEDFTLPSGSGGASREYKSYLEWLAGLRDRHRRPIKYRAPPKTRNYSLVLRDVISAQMEVFSESQTSKDQGTNKKESETSDSYQYKNIPSTSDKRDTYYAHRNKYSRDRDKEHENNNTGRNDRSSTENTRSGERDSRSTENNSSREKDRSRKKRSSSREVNKYNEYRSEKRHKQRDTYNYGEEFVTIKKEREESDHSYKYKNITSTSDTRDTYYAHRNKHSRDRDKEHEHNNTGRYDKSSTENTRSRRHRSRKESSSSREVNKYNEYRREKRYKERDTYSYGEDFVTIKKESEENNHSNKYKNIPSTSDTRDTYYAHRNKHSRDRDKEHEHNNTGRCDKRSTKSTRSSERHRSRKESSSSKEVNKYKEYRSEKRRKERDTYNYSEEFVTIKKEREESDHSNK